MAVALTGELQPSAAEEALDLLLDVLPGTQQLIGLLKKDERKPDKNFPHNVTHFQTATHLLYGFLQNVKRLKLIDEASQAVHGTAECLENVVRPNFVPPNLAEIYNTQYPNLFQISDLKGGKSDEASNQKIGLYFYQVLKIKQPRVRRELLNSLKPCVNNLQTFFGEIGGHEDPEPDIQEPLEEHDDIWTDLKSAYDSIAARPCDLHQSQEIHEMRLQLSTKLEHEEFRNHCALSFLIKDANSSDVDEMHLLVPRKQRNRTPHDRPSSHGSPKWYSSQKEVHCLSIALQQNPDPSFFSVNLAVKESKLLGLQPSKRRFSPEGLNEQIAFGNLFQSKNAEWRDLTKLVLAVILAHSLVYLNDSPWLKSCWSRSSIFFYKRGHFLPAQPFLRTEISKDSKDSLEDDDGYHRYPGILDFGLALLEIHLGKRIDEDLTTNSRRWGKASQVLFMEQWNMRDQYRSAVSACLDPDFGGYANCTPRELRQQIFKKVVKPLKAELTKGFMQFLKANPLDDAAKKIDLISGNLFQPSDIHQPTMPSIAPLDRKPATVPKLVHAPGNRNAMQKGVTVQGHPATNKFLFTIAASLPPPISESFSLFEDENQPQSIPEELCRQTDKWIENFKYSFVKLNTKSSGAKSTCIKVAILDSGIDVNHTDIDAWLDRIKDIRSWVDGKAGEEDWDGGDESGHGTHIAGIILDLAPNVDIYVARVTKTRELEDTKQIEKAIEYAWKHWDVDIITISFGFQEVITPIFRQINEAMRGGKVVFAAASNDGGNSPRAFPARQTGVICVHSTDAKGNKSSFNPSPKDGVDNFSILGQYIRSSWPDPNVAGATRRMTGTSFSTPVAVALATFMIAYIQQEIPDLDTPIELMSPEGIKALFQLLRKVNGKRDDYDWITPFQFFQLSPGKIREDIKYALTP